MHGCVGDLALFMFLLLFFVYRSRAWISRREISVLSVFLKESLMGCVGSEIKLERGRVASLEMMAIFSAIGKHRALRFVSVKVSSINM